MFPLHVVLWDGEVEEEDDDGDDGEDDDDDEGRYTLS